LPTEAEVEYATRAGAATSRYYGETDELLEKYAWYNKNSDGIIRPGGEKKPNDLGFFDLHGNVWCWCQEAFASYPTANEGAAVVDEGGGLPIVATVSRSMRGGSFFLPASYLRCACRYNILPSSRNFIFGFRVARTLRLGSLTSLPLPPKAGDFEKQD
jgi:eukaryotic-like serine/threonine-protein kinase